MVRGHLPAAMQGLAVVPLFAGFDTRRNVGRLFEYDVTGGRYEESDFAATGSGSMHAGTVIKIGYRRDLDRSDAIDLVINAVFQAADEDSATGGPDPVRRIFPMIATITSEGFQAVEEDEVSDRFAALVDRLSIPASTTAIGAAPGATHSAPGGSLR
jgi:proteasome beta subunit